ncbi:MAG: TonB-dependent receptor [Burkholderiales bacterium]|nr:TonB-dependent receptor [Burkholderiales bacterium]
MNPAFRWPAAACGLGLALSFPLVHAADGATTIVVTGTRTAQTEADALSDLRVIDSSTLRAAGAQTLAEVLQAYGGAEIVANGGAGQPTGVSLRGTNTNHVVVLVDGVRMGSATTGMTALENIPLDQIDHIEILRGPASSLYGSDAIGGVIQIFTRRGTRTTLDLGAGTWDTRKAAFGLGREWGDTRLSLQAGYSESKSFPATNAAAAYSYNPSKTDDPYRNTNFGLDLEHGWAAGQSLALHALYSQGHTHYDSGPGNDDANDQRLSSLSLQSSNRVNASWTSLLTAARGSDHMTTLGSYPGSFDTDQDQLSWQNDFSAAGGKLLAGLDWRRETVQSSTAYTVASRSVAAVFAGYSARFGAHSVELSLRDDRYSRLGQHATGKLAWGLRFAPGWRWSASAGTAFKAPTINDLYYPFDGSYSGNPDLKPERSRNLETGLRFERGSLRAGVTLFQNTIDDLIELTPDYSTVVNLANARIRGLTLDGAWRLDGWQLHGEWTLQTPVDTTTGSLLPRRARSHASAGVDKSWGAWQAGADWVVSQARFNADPNTEANRMGGYGLVNLHASWSPSRSWTLSARLDNVADKSYELAQGYNTPGRNLFVGLKYSFD